MRRSTTARYTLLLTLLAACGGDDGTGPAVATTLQIAPSVSSIDAVGDSVRLVAAVRDQNGDAMDDAVVEWSSANEAVATVSADGWVVAVATGTVSIAAAMGDLGDEAAVSVGQVAATVTLTAPDDTLAEGESVLLSAVVADANGVAIPGAVIVWTTSDEGAATVDATGRVTAVRGAAPATITATAGTATGQTEIAVLGKIVFQSERTGNSDIYVMNTDGSGVTALTSDPATDNAADWSPDGQRIAFVSERDGDAEIYTMDADGSDVLRLTTSVSEDRVPSWSPDGTRITFHSDRDGGNGDIYVMDANGSNVVRLTDDPEYDYAPTWSPDGTKIAFDSYRDGNAEIFVMNADGSGTPTPLTANTAPDANSISDWSPDGSRIAFTAIRGADMGVVVMNADGSGATDLTTGTVQDLIPRWTPDGRILFSSSRDGNLEVYLMNADGSNVVRLTNDSATDGVAHWRP